jgi:hypothetical protein
MRAAIALLFGFGLLPGCGAGDSGPSVDPPAAPAENDPRFEITGVLGWYLVGNDLTPGGDALEAEIHAPDGTGAVDAWIDGAAGVRLDAHDGVFTLAGDIAALLPGEHEVLFAADGADTAFARLVFQRSHPLYVFVSTDWDYSEPSDRALDFQVRMHFEHPEMRVTNFVGPYTFTDDVAVPDSREQEIVDWLVSERDEHDGEIALHIHPYCNFVEYAGVTCNTDESTVHDTDTSGYTIGLWAYGETDFGTLLAAADQLFMDHGLGKPVTFRAGGWTATIETLRALADHGYVADTSALNWARLDEWIGDGTLYSWNMEHWGPIGDTSQPYYPNDGDILSGGDPTLSILEVPDNAIMADYVSVEEMTDILDQNWDGTALDEPTTYMMGYHPSGNLPSDTAARVDGLLDVTDEHLASAGEGPVVYEVLKNMPAVFSR